jgi:hypothetical protein
VLVQALTNILGLANVDNRFRGPFGLTEEKVDSDVIQLGT